MLLGEAAESTNVLYYVGTGGSTALRDRHRSLGRQQSDVALFIANEYVEPMDRRPRQKRESKKQSTESLL